MDEIRITIRLDQDNPDDLLLRDLLMSTGRHRTDLIRCWFNEYWKKFGSLGIISSAEVPVVIRMIQTQGLGISNQFNIPAPSIQTTLNTITPVKSKKTKGKKTSKEPVYTKSISAEPVQTAPAEKISPAPVQEIQSVSPVSEAAQSDEAQVDDKFITLEEYNKKCIELAQKYILEHFATGQQALGLQMSWHEYETDEDWDELYQMLVEDCTFLANPNNKLPEDYTSMKKYVEDQLADQGYRVKFDN